MKRIVSKVTIFILCFSLFGAIFQETFASDNIAERLAGYILLQVEEHGEAWYVVPDSAERYYLEDGDAAYNALREFGLGITNSDLNKIPVGLEARFEDTDSDSDGLADTLEEGLGTNPFDSDSDDDGRSDSEEILIFNSNPLGSGSLGYNSELVDRLRGKILLQVESRGEAWYLNPTDGKRYYMKDGNAAYQIMRYLSLGITNSDLALIPDMNASDYFLFGINETINFSTIDFRVNSISENWYESCNGSYAYSTNQDYEFLTLHFSITNTTSENLSLDPNRFVLVDTSSNYNAYLPDVQFFECKDNHLSNKVFVPGTETEAVIIYNVPSIESQSYLLPMDKAGTNETYMLTVNESEVLCSEHISWTEDECNAVANDEIWLGMDYWMLVEERGLPDSKTSSNYGYGNQWQWCWYDFSPMCFYDDNDDDLVDAYN